MRTLLILTTTGLTLFAGALSLAVPHKPRPPAPCIRPKSWQCRAKSQALQKRQEHLLPPAHQSRRRRRPATRLIRERANPLNLKERGSTTPRTSSARF